MKANLTSLQEAMAMLRTRGIALSVAPGEYVVNWFKGSAATEYRAGELEDAIAHGLAMDRPPKLSPPHGPMGTPKASRRASIYAHNRKLAARRRRDRAG